MPCIDCATELCRLVHHTPSSELYTLSLHDALPISCHSASCTRSRRRTSGRSACCLKSWRIGWGTGCAAPAFQTARSEEHTSELQSQFHLVCRLLLEKKKNIL